VWTTRRVHCVMMTYRLRVHDVCNDDVSCGLHVNVHCVMMTCRLRVHDVCNDDVSSTCSSHERRREKATNHRLASWFYLVGRRVVDLDEIVGTNRQIKEAWFVARGVVHREGSKEGGCSLPRKIR